MSHVQARPVLPLLLLLTLAGASRWPGSARMAIATRGGARHEAPTELREKKRKKLERESNFANAERARAEKQTGKLKSGSKIELGSYGVASG